MTRFDTKTEPLVQQLQRTAADLEIIAKRSQEIFARLSKTEWKAAHLETVVEQLTERIAALEASARPTL